MKFYSQEICMPKNAQEGIMNFVQMIINDLEAGETRDALLKAVDLKNDLASKIYRVTMDEAEDTPSTPDTFGINKR